MSDIDSVTTDQGDVKRWMFVRSILERVGPLADPDFEASENVIF